MNKMKAITLSTLTGLVTLGLLMVFLGGLNVGLPTAHADIAIDANNVAADASESSVVINEIMQNPDANDGTDREGEWIELYNAGSTDVDINGWTIADDDSDEHEISNTLPLTIPAGGYLVLGHTITQTKNGTVTVDYEYGNDLQLANDNDELVLTDTKGERVDYITWTNSYEGASMQLVNPDWDNENTNSDSWREATTPWGAETDMGTPGEPNYALVLCAKPMGDAAAVDTNVRAEFNLEMTGVDSTTFTLEDYDGSSVTGTAAFYTESLKAVFTPTEKLDHGTTYTATLSQGLTDTRGLTLGIAYPDGYMWTFTTTERSLAVVGKGPADDADGVTVTANVTASFNYSVTNVTSQTFMLAGPDGKVTGTIEPTTTAKTFTFDPKEELAYNTLYTATLDKSLKDTEEITLGESHKWTFTTEPKGPNLDITKTVVPTSSVAPGDVVTYTIKLANSGDAEATGVMMTDTLPSEIKFGGWIEDELKGSAELPTPQPDDAGKITWGPWTITESQCIQYVFTATLKFGTLGLQPTNKIEFTSDTDQGSAEAPFEREYYIFLPLVARNYGG